MHSLETESFERAQNLLLKDLLSTKADVSISVRLSNIIYREGFGSNVIGFIKQNDAWLMALRNFGKNCLEEVYLLRKALLKKDLTGTHQSKQVQGKKPTETVGDLIELSGEVGQRNLALVLSSSSMKDLRIDIPEEVGALDLRYILRFTHRLGSNVHHSLKRLLNQFNYFGQLDGMTLDELLKTPNIGRGTFRSFANWLSCFHSGSFTSLAHRIADCQQSLKEIQCTQQLLDFLGKQGIDSLEDISELDRMNLAGLSKPEKLSLVELRTLALDHATGQLTTGANATSDKTIVEWVDEFIQKYLNTRERTIVIERWNDEAAEKTLEQVARSIGLTRERVRQIIKGIITKFEDLYVSEDDEGIMIDFRDQVVFNLSPVEFKDLIGEKGPNLEFSKNLYPGFLSHVLDSVPFLRRRYGYVPSRLGYTFVDSEYYDREHELYEMAVEPNFLSLCHFLTDKPIKTQLQYMKAIFVGDRLSISKKGDDVFLNRKYYGMIPVIQYCVRYYNRPVQLEEIVDFLDSTPFYRERYRLGYEKQASLRGKGSSSVFSMLNSVPSFVRLDRFIWGLGDHMGYPKSQWGSIGKACRTTIRQLGHQASASYLFEHIKDDFPNLRSKYELNHILRRDPGLKHLGFMTYVLEESGQKHRLKIKDLVLRLFEENSDPKAVDEIFSSLEKHRTMPARQGLRSTLSGIDGIVYYRPNYSGLKKYHKENLKYLSTNEHYVTGFLSLIYPDTSVDNIMEKLEVDEPKEIYLRFLNKCNHLVHMEMNGLNIFLHEDWTDAKKAIVILGHSGKSMFLEELVIMLKGELGIRDIDRNTLRSRLKLERHVRFLKNSKYEFVDTVGYVERYQLLLDDIADYLVEKAEFMDVSDLQKVLSENSEFETPSSPEELLTLLELDNRFKVLAEGVVGLL